MTDGASGSPEHSTIAFAEKVLAMLDQGRFTATYKFAVLLSMMDLCMEKTDRAGATPDLITTRELAEKVVELYWPHAAPFPGLEEPRSGVRVAIARRRDASRV